MFVGPGVYIGGGVGCWLGTWVDVGVGSVRVGDVVGVVVDGRGCSVGLRSGRDVGEDALVGTFVSVGCIPSASAETISSRSDNTFFVCVPVRNMTIIPTDMTNPTICILPSLYRSDQMNYRFLDDLLNG